MWWALAVVTTCGTLVFAVIAISIISSCVFLRLSLFKVYTFHLSNLLCNMYSTTHNRQGQVIIANLLFYVYHYIPLILDS